MVLDFDKTSFYEAVEKGNIEIIKILLTNPKIDINIPMIIIDKFQCDFKTIFLMEFIGCIFKLYFQVNIFL